MGWIKIIIGMGIFFFFVRFTTVKEGTAKVVVRMGAFKRILISWKDYTIDKNNEVIPGKGLLHLPGGLRFVGIWPFDRIYKYSFRWQNIRMVEGKEKAEFREQEIDYISVKPEVYLTEIKAAETAPPERIPLTVQFLITMRVSNPYKVLFNAPHYWNDKVMARFNAFGRSWLATKKLDDVLELMKDPFGLWKEFKDAPLIKMLKQEWGITIEENGIEIKNIELPPEYQAAAATQRKLEFEAAARSAETVGTVLEMMARARGKKVKEIQKEIEKSPEMREEFLELAKDLIVRKLGIEGKSYLDIRVQGAKGLEKTILNALAAFKRMPTGKESEEKEENKSLPQEPEKEPEPSGPFKDFKEKKPMEKIHQWKKKKKENK